MFSILTRVKPTGIHHLLLIVFACVILTGGYGENIALAKGTVPIDYNIVGIKKNGHHICIGASHHIKSFSKSHTYKLYIQNCDGSTAQIFKSRNDVTFKHKKLCIGTSGPVDNGTHIVLIRCGTNHRHALAMENNDGLINILNYYTGQPPVKCVDGTNYSTKVGTVIQAWKCHPRPHRTKNQLWKIVKIGGTGIPV